MDDRPHRAVLRRIGVCIERTRVDPGRVGLVTVRGCRGAADSVARQRLLDGVPQEISSLLGVSVAGVSTGKDPGRGDCSWTNASTDESVSLRIGNPGTALNNTLPGPEPGFPDPTTPGPDGMRYLGNGGVEFAAGGRVDTVQVAVLRLSADQANSAAVTLAREIVPQVDKSIEAPCSFRRPIVGFDTANSTLAA